MNKFLEFSPYAADQEELIGKDPRTIEDWGDRKILVGMKAIRAKCLDCAHTASEVRKCVCVDCPLWPLRMGTYPKSIRKRNNADAS